MKIPCSTKPAPLFCGFFVRTRQHCLFPVLAVVFPHPLQNRVPRVQVLLPLPKKSGIASAVPDFFVSVRKDSATRHGCAPRSACRGASACQWHASYEPTEAAAETSPSLDFLLAFRVFSSGFTRSQLFPSSPAPKTHPISPFWGFSGCVSLFLSSFDLQNFRAGFCAGCHSHSFTTPSYMPQYLSSIYSFPPVAPDSSQLTVFPART